MEKKTAKIISYITIAPVMAFGMLTLLYFTHNCDFKGLTHYIFSVIYLTVLPILAYPMQKILPKFKDKGRDGQRKLAFIMVVLGYTLGIISALILKAPKNYLTIYLGYFLSGIILTLINKLLKIKASGHACGVMGPVLICIYFIGKYSWLFLLLIPIVFWSRLTMGRHTLRELLLGTSVSFFCILLSIAVTH
ncbi:MAG: hypothetical protein WCQ54_06810 [Clostridiaceae bacterium]